MSRLFELIKELSLVNGASGREDKVREYILSQIRDHCRYHVDNIGNIIAFKKGNKTPKNKVMIDAHMDEVGIIATYITDDGLIKFITVGGVDPKVIMARQFVFENGTVGVAGAKPIHLLKGDEKDKIPEVEDMYIDIGASNKEEAEKLVSVGMTGVFISDYVEFGDNKVKGKALDDRVGCAIMIDMILSGVEYDTYFSFSVQEEVGLRGAQVSAFGIAADYAIALESTTAADIIDVPDHKKVCILGNGATVSFMDKSTLYSKKVFDTAFDVAERNGIKIQTKTMVAGGNNAGAIHKSGKGIKTVAINVPCRYLHSACCVSDKRDIESVRKLAEKVLEEFAMS